MSRITYAALFAVIGTNFGEGYGTNTFNLPDLRGRFLRGLDETDPTNIRDADRDLRIASNPGGNVGNNIGSLQDDAIRNITATCRDGMHYNAAGRSSSGAITLGAPSNALSGTTHSSALTVVRDTAIFDASNVVPTGGDNRPKNVVVNYIIKI